jgi:hypothetical protein
MGNRFLGVSHYGAEQPSESITQEQKKNQETEVWARTPSRNKDLEAMSTSHLRAAHIDNTYEIQKRFFIEINQDYNRTIKVITLPHSFDWKLKKFLFCSLLI